MPSDLIDALLSLDPRQYVTLSGHPDGEETRWHVNNHLRIGESRRAIILQKADASEHWIVAILKKEDEVWEIDTFSSFEGAEPPTDLGSGDAGEPIDHTTLKVTDIENS